MMGLVLPRRRKGNRMKNIRIGVVGMGIVGKATARCFLEHVAEVKCYDCIVSLGTHHVDDVLRCDLVIVCLPEDKCEDFFRRCPSSNYVLRSTVPVGFTKRISEEQHHSNLVHWPCFATERCSLVDEQMPARNIIGIPRYMSQVIPDPEIIERCGEGDYRVGHSQCSYLLFNTLIDRFPSVPLQLMSSDETETVKLMTNAFFATKVSLFNEFYAFCKVNDMDWEAVRLAILADGRICPSHTQVPGPDGKMGFGGRCLPKDLDILIQSMMETRSAIPEIIASVKRRNLWDR